MFIGKVYWLVYISGSLLYSLILCVRIVCDEGWYAYEVLESTIVVCKDDWCMEEEVVYDDVVNESHSSVWQLWLLCGMLDGITGNSVCCVTCFILSSW